MTKKPAANSKVSAPGRPFEKGRSGNPNGRSVSARILVPICARARVMGSYQISAVPYVLPPILLRSPLLMFQATNRKRHGHQPRCKHRSSESTRLRILRLGAGGTKAADRHYPVMQNDDPRDPTTPEQPGELPSLPSEPTEPPDPNAIPLGEPPDERRYKDTIRRTPKVLKAPRS